MGTEILNILTDARLVPAKEVFITNILHIKMITPRKSFCNHLKSTLVNIV